MAIYKNKPAQPLNGSLDWKKNNSLFRYIIPSYGIRRWNSAPWNGVSIEETTTSLDNVSISS